MLEKTLLLQSKMYFELQKRKNVQVVAAKEKNKEAGHGQRESNNTNKREAGTVARAKTIPQQE